MEFRDPYMRYRAFTNTDNADTTRDVLQIDEIHASGTTDRPDTHAGICQPRTPANRGRIVCKSRVKVNADRQLGPLTAYIPLDTAGTSQYGFSHRLPIHSSENRPADRRQQTRNSPRRIRGRRHRATCPTELTWTAGERPPTCRQKNNSRLFVGDYHEYANPMMLFQIAVSGQNQEPRNSNILIWEILPRSAQCSQTPGFEWENIGESQYPQLLPGEHRPKNRTGLNSQIPTETSFSRPVSPNQPTGTARKPHRLPHRLLL